MIVKSIYIFMVNELWRWLCQILVKSAKHDKLKARLEIAKARPEIAKARPHFCLKLGSNDFQQTLF